MAKNKPSIIAVCDSGPIIHLDELDSLSLLADFRLMVPHAVREEIHHHRPTALSWIQKNSQKGIVPERVPHNLLVISSALSLDKGEMEALCLMINRPDSLLLTDDAAARLAAQ